MFKAPRHAESRGSKMVTTRNSKVRLWTKELGNESSFVSYLLLWLLGLKNLEDLNFGHDAVYVLTFCHAYLAETDLFGYAVQDS